MRRLPLLKTVTAVGLASYVSVCGYNYWNRGQRISVTEQAPARYASNTRAMSQNPHIGDGVLMPTKTLNDGHSIPMLGLGTWELGNVHGRGSEKEVVDRAVDHALRVGYRHFDCASDYLNEHLVGDALSESMARHGISREDVFVTSKLNQPYHSSKVCLASASTNHS